ncbi:unnamed protein product [Allacma fusca]|uniref:Beta-mannosidase Ig-fold domain-containing protein n=1 Tax=Allacma fusca TaxID=39272 RepID=A0A8J2P845_9HEXA|nr:unnamed protein product [Allacma fusca]
MMRSTIFTIFWALATFLTAADAAGPVKTGGVVINLDAFRAERVWTATSANSTNNRQWNGRWKLLHYYAQNFFAPVIVSPYKAYDSNGREDGVNVDIVSDLVAPVTRNLSVKVFRLNSLTPLMSATGPISVITGWTQNSSNNTFSIDIAADTIALFVTLSMKDVHIQGTFSDNGFIMTSTNKTIEFTSKAPLTLPEFQRNLEFCCVFGSFNVVHEKAFMIPAKIAKWTSLNRPNTFSFDLIVNTVALFVTLNINDVSTQGTFSDNGFTMTSPTKTIVFEGHSTLTLEDFQRSLEFWSLYDLVLPVQSAQWK